MISPLVKSRLLHRWRWQKWDKQIFLQWSVWSSGPENNPPLLPLQTRSAWPKNQSNSAMAEIPHHMHCKTECNNTQTTIQNFSTWHKLSYDSNQGFHFKSRALCKFTGCEDIMVCLVCSSSRKVFLMKNFRSKGLYLRKPNPSLVKTLMKPPLKKISTSWTVVWIKEIVTKPKSTFKANLWCLVLGRQIVKKLVFIWI